MRIAITGANGFVGRHVVARLLHEADAADLRAIVRDPARAAAELPRAGLDVRRADVTSPETLRGVFDGMDAVVHTVAIPTERQGSFTRVNADGARAVVREAERAGVRRLVDVSAIGASPDSPYPFLRTKGEGQAAVEASAIPHVVLRPSILFGPGDDFFHRLRFALRFPIAPLPGGGTARFQPLHVEDLADAIRAAVFGTMAGVFELTMADPPVTRGQLDLLAVDNTPHPNAIDQVFGVAPRPFLNGGLSYLAQR